jgi:hypothetical protein
MIIFDLFLLVFVSGMLALKSLYLGSITLVVGVLLGFQNQRTVRLLGVFPEATSVSRKVKAGLLALVLGLCALPFLLERQLQETEGFNNVWTEETILPLVIVIGLFAATSLAALTVEKRKR